MVVVMQIHGGIKLCHIKFPHSGCYHSQQSTISCRLLTHQNVVMQYCRPTGSLNYNTIKSHIQAVIAIKNLSVVTNTNGVLGAICDYHKLQPNMMRADSSHVYFVFPQNVICGTQWQPVTQHFPIHWDFFHVICSCHLSKSNLNFDML